MNRIAKKTKDAKAKRNILGSVQKRNLVLRLIRGESPEKLAEEVDRTIDELISMKEKFIRAGCEALKRRSTRSKEK